MKRTERWWIVFAACNVIVAAALFWTSAVVINLERSELVARAETDHQESLRLAMWRMDSWLSLFLAREAARPRFEYRSFRPGDRAGVLDPSPQATLDPDYLLLHVEIDPDGIVRSPQLPVGPIDRIPGLPDEVATRRSELLEQYRPYLALETVRAAVASADSLVAAKLGSPVNNDDDSPRTQLAKTQNEFDARVACSVPRPQDEDSAGRQAVVWLDSPDGQGDPALVFLRRVGSARSESFQGFLLDWPRLRERLLFEIEDLFPSARLERRVTADASIDPLGRGLANIPIALIAPAAAPTRGPWVTSGRAALAVAWLAAILAAVAVGTTLRKSIDLGERRQRFVSAVTHELRTPLTTFQMYSEMLADGQVTDEKQRMEYLHTLKDEAQRLSAMVGNVLTHACLEEKRAPRRTEELDLDRLISRLAPRLERRAESSGMTLEVRNGSSGGAPLSVDPETIGQILTNLVDNAAKYADGSMPTTIHLDAAMNNGSLILTVRDHGPGVSAGQARAIFAPFERGGRDPSDPVPGVGLGLALSRGLARDMGGELTLENPGVAGASFRLELPAVAAG